MGTRSNCPDVRSYAITSRSRNNKSNTTDYSDYTDKKLFDPCNPRLIQINRPKRILQFILPLHQFLELLVHNLHTALFLLKSVTEAVFGGFLILFDFHQGVF